MSSQQIDMERLLELINDGYRKLARTQDKEAIFVFGKTGSGKSTLISFLMGFGFVKEKKKLIRINNLTIQAPEIGQGVISCTLVPDVYYLELDNGKGIYFIDTAGVGDTRGPTEDLYTKIALQIAIMCPTSIKAIIAVIEEAQIASMRGIIFSEVAQTLFSICNGSEFHDSFFLFVTKTKSDEDQIFETLEELMEDNRNAALKTANNQQLAQKYSQVEGVIAIFLSTKNIVVVDPFKDESRKKLLNMINNSKPIPKSCIGKAMNSKIQNELKNLLSGIAFQGSAKLSEIQKNLNKILQKQQNQKIENKRVQTLDNQLKEHQDQINKSEKTIKEREAEIQKTKKSIQSEKAKLTTYKTEKTNLEASIKAKEGQQTKEEQALKNTSKANNQTVIEMELKKKQIKSLEQKIEQLSSVNKASQTIIDTKDEEIKQNEKLIKAAKAIIANPAEIDKQPEVKSFLSSFNHSSDDLKQKDAVLQAKISALQKATADLSSAKLNQTKIELSSYSWCEATVYGRVKKGIVHRCKFQHSSEQLIVDIKKEGTISTSQGNNGYWSDQKQSKYYCIAYYNTPSHVMGWASYKVFGYQRDSKEGLQKIKLLQQAVKKASQQKDQAETDKNLSLINQTKGLNELNKQRQKSIKRLEGEINAWEQKNSEFRAIVAQNKKNLNQTELDNLKQQLNTLNSQLTALTNKIYSQDASLKNVEVKVNQIKNQISAFRQNLSNKQTSITTSEVDITKLQKLVEKYQTQIKVNKSNIETQTQNIDKNKLNTKQSQDQLESIANSISSIIELIKKEWKEFYTIEAKGSFNCMSFLYKLMKLESKAIDEFLSEYGKIGQLEQKCKANGIQTQQIKKEAYKK